MNRMEAEEVVDAIECINKFAGPFDQDVLLKNYECIKAFAEGEDIIACDGLLEFEKRECGEDIDFADSGIVYKIKSIYRPVTNLKEIDTFFMNRFVFHKETGIEYQVVGRYQPSDDMRTNIFVLYSPGLSTKIYDADTMFKEFVTADDKPVGVHIDKWLTV